MQKCTEPEQPRVDITRRAMLVSLTIRSWSGKLTDLGVSREVATRHNALSKAGSYKKNLVDPAAVKSIQRSRSLIRQTHYAMTTPWDNNNNRLLSMRLYEDYRNQLDTLIEQHRDEVAQFVDNYAGHVEYAAYMLGDMFDANEYPSAEEIRTKFHVEYQFEPVTKSEHLVVELSNRELDRIRRSIQTVFDDRVSESLRSMYDKLNKCVTKFNERTGKDGDSADPKVFRDSLLENLREAVELIPSMNIYDDEILNDMCAKTLAAIDGVTANMLREKHADFDDRKAKKVREHTEALEQGLAGYFGGEQ